MLYGHFWKSTRKTGDNPCKMGLYRERRICCAFAVKYMINDACVLAKKPFVHGGILGFSGQVLTVLPGTACFRCFFRDPPPKEVSPTCAEAGVVGVTPGFIGSLQATEVVKYLTGSGTLLTNTLLVVHADDMEFARLELPEKDENCPVCGKHSTILKAELAEQNACEIKE